MQWWVFWEIRFIKTSKSAINIFVPSIFFTLGKLLKILGVCEVFVSEPVETDLGQMVGYYQGPIYFTGCTTRAVVLVAQLRDCKVCPMYEKGLAKWYCV